MNNYRTELGTRADVLNSQDRAYRVMAFAGDSRQLACKFFDDIDAAWEFFNHVNVGQIRRGLGEPARVVFAFVFDWNFLAGHWQLATDLEPMAASLDELAGL